MKHGTAVQKRAVIFSLVFLAGFFAAGRLLAENKIENVTVTESEDGESAIILIETYLPLRYSLKEVSSPPQIVIQFEEDIACMQELSQPQVRKLVKSVKYSCKEPAKKLLDKIIFQLDQKCQVTASQKEWFLSVTAKKISSGLSPSVTSGDSPRVTMDRGAFDAETEGLAGDEPGVAFLSLSAHPTVEEFINVGLMNHRPLAIAQKELKFAKKKLWESRRNLLPTLSAKGTQTEGQTQSDPNDPTTQADFTRKEVGLEIGQPLFQSGRLFYSAKQARVQKDIAELQIQKITLETTFEIVKALYTFIQMRESLEIVKTMMKEAQKVVDITERKKEIGVASESEVLGILSAANQAEYKMISQEKDLEISRTRLQGILNVESLPEEIPVHIEGIIYRAPSEEPKLDNLISLAFANRPEIKIAYLTRKYKEYGVKVSQAERLFKVDASGFVGQSGAAFRGESLAMKDSYNVGVKGTLYFGGSSINPMVSNEKTAPELGSTSRTETRAQNVTIGILDSLALGSGVLQAVIDKEKAAEDYRKAKRDVLVEVKEAFFNYQKAKSQIEFAKKEREYRKKELAIATAKDKLHQIEAPQLMQVLSGLMEAEVGLKEAASFYKTSLAALDKATGVKESQ